MRKLYVFVLVFASTPVLAGVGDGTGNGESFGGLFLTLQDILASIASLFL